MIWFDIKELERRLKNDDFSDKEIFNYVLTTAVFSAIAPYLGGTYSETTDFLAVKLVITLLIMVIGTKATFDINSSGDGKDYFRRLVSLSWVTGIRLFVFAFIAAFPIGAIAYFVNKNAATNHLVSLMTFTVLLTLYYFMLTNSFKRVSQ